VANVTEKSAQAFRTISEVSEELGIPQHVLRFWETRFSQIKPLKRGGNRRYYRPQDIDLLRAISHLHYVDGFTLKGVQKLIRENGVKTLVKEFLNRDGSAPFSIMVEQEQHPDTDTPSSQDDLQGVLDELKAIKQLLDDNRI
jgi:DNA-binding transcriptional MerR regulator